MSHRAENSVELPDYAGDSPSERALAEAAEWHVRLGEDDAAEDDWRTFERWLKADHEHSHAWREIEATWDALAGARRSGARAVLERTYREERHEVRRLLGWGTGVLLLLLALLPVAWLVMGIASQNHLLADHHTAVGERKTIELPDGSRLVLNTATAVDVRFDAQRRRIYLHDGEIHITTAADAGRPLDVITDEARAQALGTRFSVRRVPGDDATVTRVSVYESRVELCPVAGDACRRLKFGQQAQASAGQVSPPVHVSPDPPAWLQGRLEVEDRPVAEVLAELARYHRGLLRYDESALAGIKVSGVLPLDDTDRALNALAATLPIRIDRYTPWLVVVSRAP